MIKIIPIKDKSKRNYYINLVDKNYLSKRQLEQEIKTDAYERLDDKTNNLRQSADNVGFDNSEKTHNILNTIEKVIKDKDYNVIFDNSIVTKTGNPVNAQITTNKNNEVEIKINPNSNMTSEFLLIHEITHAIETDNIKKLIIDYAIKHTKFNSTLESIKQAYKTDEINSELVADIAGQLLGNQEFINNLSTHNPSLFKKIYNKIIELANRITGNLIEKLFIKDLKNKWKEAYRTQNNNLDKIQKYSIQQDPNSNKFVNVDTDQDIFDGKTLAEQTKIAKKYILDNFRENGIYMNSDNISVTSKTANEYTHPNNQLPKTTKESKMKASTELDNLIKVSEYSHSAKDDSRHPFAKDGWDYYKTTFKVGNKSFEGLINIGKSGNKKTLYDITNIKRISQNRSTSTNVFSTSLANSSKNNISNFNKNVKSDIPTNYYIQKRQNNTKKSDEQNRKLSKQQ